MRQQRDTTTRKLLTERGISYQAIYPELHERSAAPICS
jgi:hypothetical protein